MSPRVLLAFAIVYLVWGSTYLALRIAIESIPPFLMAAMRFLLAGTVLFAWLRVRGAPLPRREEWRTHGLIGALLFLCSHGGVVYATLTVPSGVVALLIGAVPLWVVLLDWIAFARRRPSLLSAIGVVVGFAGIAILIDPHRFASDAPIDVRGALAVVCGSIGWAAGTLHASRARSTAHPMMATAVQMLVGGALLLCASALRGELPALHAGAVTARSITAFLYLSLVGSLVAFSAYSYLLRHAPPMRVSTYAYVNPVVAVVLGWAYGGEPLGMRTLVAMCVIVGAVALITVARRARPSTARA
jgi:drug/metabolite transporter (DMT)-like permease